MKLDETIFEVLLAVSELMCTGSIAAVALAKVELEGSKHYVFCSALQNWDDFKSLKPLLFPEASA